MKREGSMKQLPPVERVVASKKGIKPDKIPISTGPTNEFICHRYGISIEDYLTNAEWCTECSIKFVREFEVDSSVVAPGYILYGCGPEVGVKWEFVENHFPGFVDGPLRTESDLQAIRAPQKPSGHFKHYLEVLSKVQDAIGDRYNLIGHILGPFATACFLHGIEATLLDTVAEPEWFKKYMERSTDLSEYFGKNVLSTGVRNPILNEIFLTPEMIGPESYHRLIAPYDIEVQRRLGADSVPNVMGAFMGRAGDRESQEGGVFLYRAFFGVNESLATITRAMEHLLPGFPFPVTLSGQTLDTWGIDRILAFLREALDFLIKEKGVYPSIHLASVLADSPEAAKRIAEKLEAIRQFRDTYEIK
jgi:hypothetical protein